MRSTLLLCCLLCAPLQLFAEDVYITDQLKAGLHEDKALDSPIVKIVATGTRLEVVKREDQLSFVRDETGSTGWINNDYLVSKAPGNASSQALQTRTDNLEKRLAEAHDKNLALEAELKNQGKMLPADTLEFQQLKTSHAELKQKFNTQKLKTGELEIELTELRNRLGQDADSDALYQQIKSLEEDRKKLQIQLARTLEKYAGVEAGGEATLVDDEFTPGVRNMAIYLAITLILGLFAGAYIVDFINRRRHGGFRV